MSVVIPPSQLRGMLRQLPVRVHRLRGKNFHLFFSTASDVDDTVKPSAAGFAAVDPQHSVCICLINRRRFVMNGRTQTEQISASKEGNSDFHFQWEETTSRIIFVMKERNAQWRQVVR